MGVPLNISHVNVGQKSFASLTQPSRRNGAEMLTTFRTFSGWRIAHCIATPPIPEKSIVSSIERKKAVVFIVGFQPFHSEPQIHIVLPLQVFQCLYLLEI